MSKLLFSFGTSRGGTTFFARVLSVNQNIFLASDPWLPLFRALRNEIARQKTDKNFDINQPLDDYYFSEDKLKVMEAIQAGSLKIGLPPELLGQLQEQISARLEMTEEELIKKIKDVSGNNFKELLHNGLALAAGAYQVENSAWLGSNDNWVIEFLPLLARSFAEAKFIIIIRDPRAVINSSLKNREKYPELAPLSYSFAQQLRKHLAFAWKFQLEPELAGRLFIIKYEDLVAKPEVKIREICAFLKVEYDSRMLKPANFRPIEGQSQWTVYSEFPVPENKIYTESVDRWKSSLDQGAIEFTEFICDPEMRLYGYQPLVYQGGQPSQAVYRFMTEDDQATRGWRGRHQTWDRELADQLFRKFLLQADPGLFNQAMIKKYFLFNEVFAACQKFYGIQSD